jgi:hypothetical protein
MATAEQKAEWGEVIVAPEVTTHEALSSAEIAES